MGCERPVEPNIAVRQKTLGTYGGMVAKRVVERARPGLIESKHLTLRKLNAIGQKPVHASIATVNAARCHLVRDGSQTCFGDPAGVELPAVRSTN